MSGDLIGVLKLVHRVTGFLIHLSPQQLAAIAAGDLTLAVNAEDPHRSASAAPSPQVAAADPGSESVGAAPVPTQRPEPRTPRPESVPVLPGADYAEIAGTLRGQQTVDDGLAFLDGIKVGGKKLAKADLLAIGKELQLTLPASVTVANAKRKLLEHAIGARRKYAGLAP
jgi:hypothetical protein